MFTAAVWLLPVVLSRVLLQRRVQPRVSFVAVQLLQHTAVALQWACIAHWLGALPASAVWQAVVYTVGQLTLLVDCILHAQSGFRFQPWFLTLLKQVALFMPDAKDRTRLRAVIVAAIAVGAGSLALFFWAPLNDPAPLRVCVLATATAWLLSRTLPASFVYECDDRVFALQISALRWPQRRDLRLPRLFHPQHEVYQSTEGFPALRRTEAFTGTSCLAPPKSDEEATFPSQLGNSPAATMRAQPKHVVLVFLESFRAFDVGALGGTKNVTPRFDALANESVLWERFYTNGMNTAQAAVAAIYGVPPHGRALTMQNDPDAPPMIGLPDIFEKRGYLPALFQAGDLAWDNAQSFFLTHGYRRTFGWRDLLHHYPQARGGDWGVFDEYLFAFHARWLQQHDAWNIPTFSTLFTISNHEPWNVPDAFEGQPGGTAYERYMRSTQYTDWCLGQYVDKLKAQGLDDRVVLCVLADTGQGVHQDRLVYSSDPGEGCAHIPLLLWRKGMTPQRIAHVGSQIDLLPTLLDYLGWHDTHHAFGSSLLRGAHDAYLARSFDPKMVGVRMQNDRFMHSLTYGSSSGPDRKEDALQAHAFIETIYSERLLAPASKPSSEPNAFAPPDYPQSLAHLSQLLQTAEPKLRNAWQVMLNTTLTEQEKLAAAQLRYKLMRDDVWGALRQDELAHWNALSEQIEAAIVAAAEALLAE